MHLRHQHLLIYVENFTVKEITYYKLKAKFIVEQQTTAIRVI